MPDVVADLMALWVSPPEEEEAARAAFARLYAPRVLVNGAEVRLEDLVARARALHAALSDVSHELLERVEAGDKLVIAFWLHGRHTGPLGTAIGVVQATDEEVSILGMDVLTLSEGRISKITVLSDELGLLSRLGAVTLL